MSLKTIPIAEATATQIAQFAREVVGIPGTAHTLGKEKIVAMIRQAGYEKDEIEIQEKPTTSEVGSPIKAMQALGGGRGGILDQNSKTDKRVKIVIAVQDTPGGADPVDLSVNGVAMRIPRGVECLIPYRYFEVLQNAKQEIAEVDGNGVIIGWRSAHTYPFNVHGIFAADHAEPAKVA